MTQFYSLPPIFFALLVCSIQLTLVIITSSPFLSRLSDNPHSVKLAQAVYQPNQPLKQSLDQFCQQHSLCFSQAEALHLVDVRNLFLNLQILSMACLVLIIILMLYSPSGFTAKIHFSSFILIVLTLSLTLISLFLWNRLFTLFHQLFFPQGNWAFPADSLILRLYPDSFWYLGGISFFTLLLIQYVFLYLITVNSSKIKQ